MKSPLLTIVTPVFNAASDLERYFSAIENQTIHPKNIEILIVDGGSSDQTRDIAKRHHARILNNPKKLAEPGVALGFEKASGEYIMILAVDNIFMERTALESLLGIFTDTKVVAVFPRHDTAQGDSIFSRYFNTFTDPYTHFVYGFAANARTFSAVYDVLEHTDTHDIYDYSSSSIYPLIALAQGFTIRRNSMVKRLDDGFDDVLTIYELLSKKKIIAYAHSVHLYHYTIRNIKDFIRKQQRAVENALVRQNSGISQRNKYLTDVQKMKQYLFFPYSFSIVAPFVVSLYNVIRTGDMIWLFHAPISFLSAGIIVFTIIKLKVRAII